MASRNPWPGSFGLTPRPSRYVESFERLPGDRGDQFEVLVDVQHRQICQLRNCGDEQIRHSRRTMMPALREDALHVKGLFSAGGLRCVGHSQYFGCVG